MIKAGNWSGEEDGEKRRGKKTHERANTSLDDVQLTHTKAAHRYSTSKHGAARLCALSQESNAERALLVHVYM